MLIPSAKTRIIKTKRCKAPGCCNEFMPQRPMQKACSPGCALSMVAAANAKKAQAVAKAERQVTKAKLAEMKPLQYWLKRTERAVNAFRRAEDLQAGHGCITCGTHDAEEWHAGHWISVGASSGTRFDPANIHLQCRQCNYFGGGKAQDYEARLPARIGKAEVDRLKHAPRSRKWTREECQALEQEYKAKLKWLQRD